MSKHPSPRLDQLRAMREAKFARSVASQRAEEKSAPVKRAPAASAEPEPEATEKPVAAKPKAPAKAAKPKAAPKGEKPAAKEKAKKKTKKKAG